MRDRSPPHRTRTRDRFGGVGSRPASGKQRIAFEPRATVAPGLIGNRRKALRRLSLLAFLGAFALTWIANPTGAQAVGPIAQAADRDCADFSSQAAAQNYYESLGGPGSDPDRLDADDDGKACDALPCPCGASGRARQAPVKATPKPKPRKRAQVISARISSVTDGDTIKVRAFGAKRDFYRVRLVGIDTPETKDPGRPVECGGRRADSNMRALSFTAPRDTNGDGLFDTDGGKGLGRFAAGVVFGALLGAGIALMFAPERGDKARHRLRRRLERLREDTADGLGRASRVTRREVLRRRGER